MKAEQQRVMDLRSSLMEQLVVMGSREATRFRQQPYRIVIGAVLDEMGTDIHDMLDKHDAEVRHVVLSAYTLEEATELLLEIE